jgi:hypothetical protein
VHIFVSTAFNPRLIRRPFSWVENESLRRRMQIANFAKLAACLYPDASEEECLMMSYYHLWVLLFVFASHSLLLYQIVSPGVPLG